MRGWVRKPVVGTLTCLDSRPFRVLPVLPNFCVLGVLNASFIIIIF